VTAALAAGGPGAAAARESADQRLFPALDPGFGGRALREK
jgi:hypothetical protein